MRLYVVRSLVLISTFVFFSGSLSATDIIDNLPYLEGVKSNDYEADTLVCATASNIKVESSTWTDNKSKKDKKGLLFKLITNETSFFSFDTKSKQISFNSKPDLTFTLDLINSTEPLDFYTGVAQNNKNRRYFLSHFKSKNLFIVSDTGGVAVEPFISLKSNFAIYTCKPYEGPK
ncbi:hypothetical protein [Leptospira licerasiae]|uniref:hypothetical protein n=1 Tax=Leptospira licerasiae TaxID=447106 RepID=UPI00301A19AF